MSSERAVSYSFLPLKQGVQNIQSQEIIRNRSPTVRRLKRSQNSSSILASLKKQSMKENSDTSSVKYTPLKLNFGKQINSIKRINTQRTSTNEIDYHPQQIDHKIDHSQLPKVAQRIDKSSSQYYKFWKMKANQYQQANFILQKNNSALQQELQILKHYNQKLQRKLKRKSPETKQIYDDPLDKQKLEKYYQLKIQSLCKKLEEQENIIKKQDLKIKQLSKQMTENYKLKNFIENMQDKVSQMQSIDENKSMRSSRIDSVKKIVMPPRLTSKSKNSSFSSLKKPEIYSLKVPDSKNSHTKFDKALQFLDDGRGYLKKSKSNYDLGINPPSQKEIQTSINQHF